MIAELVLHYRVQTITAVLKRENWRSQRLLERLNFELASAESSAAHEIEPGEIMMQREFRTNELSGPCSRK
jgi:hypothetical protein